MEKLKISYPVVVEGKYDKIKLEGIIDAVIITTDGFGIFNEKEKNSLIKRLADEGKIIIFTDSDGAGLVIRNHFSKHISKDKIINIYSPQIKGKESRKAKPSKEGFIGVEGQDADTIRALFLPFASDREFVKKGDITKLDFYNSGLSGKDNSKQLRDVLCSLLKLPTNMSANALLEALNILYTKDEFIGFLQKL